MLGAVWLGLSSPPSYAEPERGRAPDWLGSLEFGGSRQPIQVAADVFEFDYKQRILRYRGRVEARQGELVVESDEMVLSLNDSESFALREVRARGHVRLQQGERSAKAEEAVFDQQKRVATLLGDVELRDGSNEIRGERVTIYLNENRTIIEGGPRERVRAVLYPPANVMER